MSDIIYRIVSEDVLKALYKSSYFEFLMQNDLEKLYYDDGVGVYVLPNSDEVKGVVSHEVSKHPIYKGVMT